MLRRIRSSAVVPAGKVGGFGGGSYRQGISLLALRLSVKFTSRSLLSVVYMTHARESCFWLLRQAAPVALSFALDNAGSNIAARIAMIAITTRSSIKVNAEER